MNKTVVCFDVDGTLIYQTGDKGMPGSIEDTPRYDVISIYKLLEALGCKMYIWSGGGIDYAERWRDKLGLLKAKVVAKGSFVPDIAFDDMEVTLGKVNIKV